MVVAEPLNQLLPPTQRPPQLLVGLVEPTTKRLVVVAFAPTYKLVEVAQVEETPPLNKFKIKFLSKTGMVLEAAAVVVAL